MKSKLLNVLGVMCLSLMGLNLKAQSVENLATGTPISHNSRSKVMGQTFTTGLTAEKIKSVEFKIAPGSGNGGMVSIDLFEVHGNTLKKIATTPRGGYNPVNVCRFTTNPKLKAQTMYAFVMNNGGSNFYNVEGSNNNAYTQGSAIQVTGLGTSSPQFKEDKGLDMYFKVNFEVPQNAEILGPGQVAQVGKKIYSPNGKFYAVFQQDGNFVVYNANNQFQRGTYNNLKAPLYGKQLVMQKDGNLRINKSGGQYLWSKYHSYNDITPNSSLFINDLGEIIIITPEGKVMYILQL